LPLEVNLAVALAKLHLQRKQPIQALPVLEYVVLWARSEEQRAEARAMLDDVKKDLMSTKR
jgi:hypothetical protein